MDKQVEPAALVEQEPSPIERHPVIAVIVIAIVVAIGAYSLLHS